LGEAVKKQYAFLFDAERCLKCWSCEIACKQWRGIPAGTIRLRRVSEFTRGIFPEVQRIIISMSCRHCARPACVAACPEGAISKRDEDGIVIVDSQKCVGCRSCLEACQFGIPQYGEDGTMQKCDMCLDRLANGQKPFCVDSCPTGALSWGKVEELTALADTKALRRTAEALARKTSAEKPTGTGS
jgi:anaerobic dimethyl sulfoxide reductase subunit B (iron-sulfur subunit)